MATDRQSLRGTRLTVLPVDIASLAAFRILFGLLMAGAMVRFLANGWVTQFYLEPTFHFTYPGFGWVRPWPGALMHAHFVVLALLALGVAAGFYYRVSIILFFVGFTYTELLDQTTYLNHYYLISLISGLLIFLPAHRSWSVDALLRPKLRSNVVRAWVLNLLRFQVGAVYLFAGVAKLNSDWLLHAQPLRIWLAARSDLPLLGPFLEQPAVAYAASWLGACFDLSIVFLLLCRKTRRAAYACVVLFHVTTWILFNIGMFPWIMIAAATLFLSPDWPRHVLTRLRVHWAMRALPCANLPQWSGTYRLFLPFGIYAAVQVFLPLRPYLAAQPAAWTCSGFNCAWQVMIVEKTGFAEFYAFDPADGRCWKVPVESYITPRQAMMMAQNPYLIRALALRMGEDLRAQGHIGIQIKVDSFATLNGRPSQRLIDPEIDLSQPVASGWILPLERRPTGSLARIAAP